MATYLVTCELTKTMRYITVIPVEAESEDDSINKVDNTLGGIDPLDIEDTYEWEIVEDDVDDYFPLRAKRRD